MEGIAAVLLINQKGEVLANRYYRGEIRFVIFNFFDCLV